MQYWPTVWPVLSWVVNIAAVGVAWSIRHAVADQIDKATAAWGKKHDALKVDVDAKHASLVGDIDDHDTAITKLQGKVEEIEGDIAKLPTKADIARVEGEVKGVAGQVSTANEGIKRIEGYFLEAGVQARLRGS